MSKGSKQRPRSVNQKTFDDNWDKIFNSKKSRKDSLDVYNDARLSTVTEKPVDSKEETK
jgi:hypothetical protein